LQQYLFRPVTPGGRTIALLAAALLVYPSTVSRAVGAVVAAGLMLANRLGRV